MIEVRIGIIESPKELILELEEESKELIEKVNAALEEGSGLVWLTDSKGKQIAVSASRIAYLEIEPAGSPEQRSVTLCKARAKAGGCCGPSPIIRPDGPAG